MLLELQANVNEKIQLGLEVTDSEMTRDEINSIMPQERTNMDLLPSFINDLRDYNPVISKTFAHAQEPTSGIYQKSKASNLSGKNRRVRAYNE